MCWGWPAKWGGPPSGVARQVVSYVIAKTDLGAALTWAETEPSPEQRLSRWLPTGAHFWSNWGPFLGSQTRLQLLTLFNQRFSQACCLELSHCLWLTYESGSVALRFLGNWENVGTSVPLSGVHLLVPFVACISKGFYFSGDQWPRSAAYTPWKIHSSPEGLFTTYKRLSWSALSSTHRCFLSITTLTTLFFSLVLLIQSSAGKLLSHLVTMASSNTYSTKSLAVIHCFTFSILLLLSAFTLALAFTHTVIIILTSPVVAKAVLLSANIIVLICSLLLSLEYLLEIIQLKTLTTLKRHQSILTLSALLFWG